MYDTIRYDSIGEFNVDSKAEYSALSSTRNQKLKQTKQCPFNSVQVKIREVSPGGIIVTIWRKGFVKEMSFKSGVKGRGSDR